MKKTIFAGLLLATMGTTTMNASTITNSQPETTQTTCRVTYVTETVNGCVITYKVTTYYFLCIPICSSKCVVKKVCDGGNEGGETFRR